MNETSQQATKLALRRYVRQIWRLKAVALPGLLLPGIGMIFTTYLPPLIVAAILRDFSSHRPTLHDILPYLALFAGVWFTGEMIWRAAFTYINRTDARGIRNLYDEAMEDLFQKDIGFFHNNFAGSLTKKVIGYGRNFEGFMDTLAFNVFASLIPVGFALVILWRFAPILVFTLAGMMLLVGIVLIPLIRNRRRLTIDREAASNKMAGHVADVIGNMDAVQAFAHQDFELALHKANVADFTKKAQRSWDYHTMRIDLAISPLYVITNVVGLALAITFGKDASSLTAIFVTFNYYASTTRVLWEFNRIYRNFENAMTEAAQFTQLLITPSVLTDPPKPIKFVARHGAIDFKHVDFAYASDAKHPLFKDFNLHIAAGEKLALVGHSGGGKSTITKLLLRFVDVTGGELLIDDQNIAHGRLADLRLSIAYVPQEPVMFHRTLRENIRYGQLDATDEDILQAARRAHAHEFIMRLPEGYETMVGERGVKLSGGQRQRIAIARAMLKNAPIIVLDEATSALDSESEKLIQDALWRLMEGRTAIIIAHRLSTIQRMDRIVVLEDGAIAEQGTHHQLLRTGGHYAKLWSHQSGGFIDEDEIAEARVPAKSA
jgi:ATP-binding cassette subfamily B protein